MRTVRLAIFCEDYWSKGLIYTQNILPLLKLSKNKNCRFEIISFTSFVMYLLHYKQIMKFKKDMSNYNVRVSNCFTYYIPTRYMTSWWFNIPLLYMSSFLYILYLRMVDRNKDIVYNLRSYEVSYLFLKLYGHFDKLIFDPRTDWITENINSGFFNNKGFSVKFWNKKELDFITKFKKTIFISEVFKDNVLKKHNVQNDADRYVVLYNPIDYRHFNVPHYSNKYKTFLYTGSLGAWNKLDTYLDFFQKYNNINKDSKLIICTSTSKDRVDSILCQKQYKDIYDKVKVLYNVPYSDLPKVYSECDFGLQLMLKKDSRVGVKVIEYVAAGLQPIVHENVQGAAFICEKYKIGIVIRSNDSKHEIIKKIESLQRLDKESENYKSFQNLSDLNRIINQLNNIYLH